MEIQRINTYNDPRFSQAVLNQHGCFLADGKPYEVEIISDREAVLRGENESIYPEIIEEFRFYTPHITRFFNEGHSIVKEYPENPFLTLNLEDIQPSQFYVDEDKIAAVGTFISKSEDIIIQVLKNGDRYISLDGHTRLYYAVLKGWHSIRAVEESSGDYIFDFAAEAAARNIHTPYDLKLVKHEEYEEKWNKFCDDFFASKEV